MQNLHRYSWLKNWTTVIEEGRDLTQSYDKGLYTNRNAHNWCVAYEVEYIYCISVIVMSLWLTMKTYNYQEISQWILLSYISLLKKTWRQEARIVCQFCWQEIPWSIQLFQLWCCTGNSHIYFRWVFLCLVECRSKSLRWQSCKRQL